VVVDGALRPFTTNKEVIARIIARYEGADYKEKIGQFVDRAFSKEAPAGLRQSVKAIMQSAPQHVAVAATRGMVDPAIWKDDEIKVPLLVILAKNPFWTADYEKYVRKLAPQVDYQVMDGVGHFLMMEKPAEFNKRLSAFLEKQGVLKP
jgi:pimeloyl-ACP methyl ester carboxylesterase